MFNLFQQNVQTGLILFVVMAVFLLAVLRFTRNLKAIRDRIKYPLIVIFILLTIFDVVYTLGKSFPPRLEAYYLAALYLALSVLIIRLTLLFLFDVFLVRSRGYRVPRLLKEITGVVLFGLALVIVLQETLKIQLTTVLATSAIITVVLGLALQETLGNLFAGLSLHLDPPYQVGDWIHTADIFGRVEEVTWRATKIRTLDNDLVITPNGQIAKERLINHSTPALPHATSFFVNVAYHVPPNKVFRVIREVLQQSENVAMDPAPDIRVVDFQDFSIKYQVKLYLFDYGIVDPTLGKIRSSIWYHFRRNEIEIPFPIRNVYLHEREEMLSLEEQKILKLSASLRKIYLFSSLDEEEIRMLADTLVPLRYSPGEMIIREGEAGDSFFIIEEGEVEVHITSLHGTRKVLTTLHDGDFFGEMALLTGERRSANVQATTDVTVYELDKERFREVLEKRPDILDQMSTELSRRKERLFDLMSEETGGADILSVSSNEAKTRILSRIRNYFGL